MTRDDEPTLSTVGHDDGRLVLHLERVVDRPAGDVWGALSAEGHRDHWRACGVGGARRDGPTVRALRPIDGSAVSGELEWASGEDTMRWEVGRLGDGARVSLTTFIDGDDVEQAARGGASSHACFDQLARLLDTGADAPPFPEDDLEMLTARYRVAVTEALADTD